MHVNFVKYLCFVMNVRTNKAKFSWKTRMMIIIPQAASFWNIKILNWTHLQNTSKSKTYNPVYLCSGLSFSLSK